MKIVPVKIKFKTLYEHRHLFTDDSHYNSLIISNAINMKVNFIDVEDSNKLDHDVKYNKDDVYSNCILDKNGLYELMYYPSCEWDGEIYEERHVINLYSWQDLNNWQDHKSFSNELFNILAIVE